MSGWCSVPTWTPLRITGFALPKRARNQICGVRIETIEEPLMREIRILDKLIDELARGKRIETILREA